jgi:uncharacterized protein (TIGR00369 family)
LTAKKSINFEMNDGRTIDFDAINRGTYAELNGIALTKIEAGIVEGEIEINPTHLNPNGFLHGGVTTTLADTLAIFGCVYLYQVTTVSTVTLNVSFLRAVRGGKITAKARSLSKGKNVSQWKVGLFDHSSLMFAEATVTIAISK